jgi:aminopeptidase N
VSRVPFWLKAVLLAIPGVLLVVFFVLISIGWYVQKQQGVSGGALRSAMAAYDVRHYALEVAVDPAARRIAGTNTVSVDVVDSTPVFEIHLDDRLTVGSVSVDDTSSDFEHDNGLIIVELATPWVAGEQHRIEIAYDGQPKTAIRAPWIDGFVWSETPSGEPWVGVTGEGDGGDNWWPCKDHPSDEPDLGMTISLTVPQGLVGLSNGRPMGERTNVDGTVTTEWRVGSPINNYGVTLNVGPYEPIEIAYHGVDGTLDETPIFWAIPEFADEAQVMWRQVPRVLEALGRRFGEYPFFADKLWVVHAPYLGMEHQTLVAYGSDFRDNEFGFDELLLHELAHEWWGNKITASEWGDFWLHEGFASYAEALFVLDTSNEDRYLEYMQILRRRMANQSPMVIGPDATSAEAYSPDVYGKGAWVLHMLRLLLGEERFAAILWTFADADRPTHCRFATTQDFIDLVERVSTWNLDWFWERYLFTAELPSWSVSRSPAGGLESVVIEWDDPNFEMPLPVQIGDKRKLVSMPGGRAEFKVNPGVEVVVDPDREVLTADR